MPKQSEPSDDSSAFQACPFGNHSNVVAFPLTDESAAGEARVERINQYEFYSLATKLRDIYLTGDVGAETVVFPLLAAEQAIERLLAGDPIDLGLSRARTEALLKAIKEMAGRHFMKPNEEGVLAWAFPQEGEIVKDWEWSWLRSVIENFEMVFSDEMREAATYRVPRKGIYDTPKLIDAADETFPPEVLAVLPQKTRDDWCAAGRCLAFNLLSASGFHVTRAVEGTLEAYYQVFSGKPGALKRSWSDYIKALQALDDTAPHGRPSAKTLAELDQMRTDYRNPIAHPRVVLTESDARMLYANGESVIIAMAQELRDVQQAAPANALLSIVAE